VSRLSRSAILQALRALARELESSPARAELLVMGGAALVLLYDARDSTKDVAVVIAGRTPVEEVRAAALRVAGSLDLRDDWLSDAAKGFVRESNPGKTLLETPSLLVRALAPEQLLAMKLCAWRDDVDIADARLLLGKLKGAHDEIWAQVEPHLVLGRELKAQYAFEDLWESEHGPR